MLDKYGEAEISIEEMTANLMRDTTKDDESKLPHIYPPEFECQLSSIFVEADTSLVIWIYHSIYIFLLVSSYYKLNYVFIPNV